MELNIKKAREKSGLNQKECAESINVSLRAWQNYEQGSREPKYEILCNIANLFDVTIDYLLNREIKSLTPFQAFAKEYNLTEQEQNILNKYCSLSPDERKKIMDMFSID